MHCCTASSGRSLVSVNPALLLGEFSAAVIPIWGALQAALPNISNFVSIQQSGRARNIELHSELAFAETQQVGDCLPAKFGVVPIWVEEVRTEDRQRLYADRNGVGDHVRDGVDVEHVVFDRV